MRSVRAPASLRSWIGLGVPALLLAIAATGCTTSNGTTSFSFGTSGYSVRVRPGGPGAYRSPSYPPPVYRSPSSEYREQRQIERRLEQEVARQRDIEKEIQQELEYQERLKAQLDEETGEGGSASVSNGASSSIDSEIARLEEELREMEEGRKPSKAKQSVVVESKPPSSGASRTVPVSPSQGRTTRRPATVDVVAEDSNGDGTPDTWSYYALGPPRLLKSREEDTNHNGRIDTWSYFERGKIVRREGDTDDDKRVDSRSHYREERLVRHEVDSNSNGVFDIVYHYAGDEVRKEERDTDSDGRPDVTLVFESGEKIGQEEDADRDGKIDTWIHLKEGLVSQVDRDLNGDGRPDRFSYYSKNGKDLVREEEDVDFDGQPDIWSYYENGELARRDTTDRGEEALARRSEGE